MTAIRRGFVDVDARQVHYRSAGDGSPVLLLHASPGSSRQLVGLIEALSVTHRVIAPDTPGNGDSPPLPLAAPAITDFALAILAFADALGLDRFDVYGSHTGAASAAELAIAAPHRVGRVILDGIGVFGEDERSELLDHYANPFVPDHDAAYLMRAWHFVRDQYLFFPWYARSRTNRRDAGLRPPGELHAWYVEVLKAAETYHLAYHAAFTWDAAARLRHVPCAALIMAAADDPLFAGTRAVAGLLPGGHFTALPRYDDAAFERTRTAEITGFLDG